MAVISLAADGIFNLECLSILGGGKKKANRKSGSFIYFSNKFLLLAMLKT